MTPMRLRCLQHVPFEGPAAVSDWARGRGLAIDTTRLYAAEPLPALDDFDWLLVMGGPMGVGDADRHPWIVPERELIRSAVEADKRVLGICLGAQLVASALGARVYPNRHREIGWFEVRRCPVPPETPFAGRFPDRLTVFHWHGDTFDLPGGAVLLAESDACRHQAFAFGGRVLALQFHLEATADSVARLVTHCGEELVEAPFVQPAERMQPEPGRFARIHGVLGALLDDLADA